MVLRAGAFAGAMAVLFTMPASSGMAAPARDSQRWHDVKCQRYRHAWEQALAHQGPEGLGDLFLAQHAAFLSSNCTARADVCARSPEELKLANTMVILSMNFGAASTLAPFYCR